MSEKHREPEVPEEEVPVVECLDGLARITSKELAITHSVKVAPSRMLVLQDQEWLSVWGEVLLCAHRQVDEQPTKRSKKNDDKSAVAMLKKGDWHDSVQEPVFNYGHDRSGRPGKKRDDGLERGSTGRRSSNARQLGFVFQDMKPPKSILRKSTNMQRPIQRVKFTKAIARHTKIRDQNPSLGNICPGEPHQRSPNAPKFEDRSQEETEWQEQGAREAAWKLAKSVLKLKEHERATFFSPSENRCWPASNLKPEEREFVVDSGASMHMISKKDLSDAEMNTLTKSCSPTIVITANGEVQTHEEATVYVKELDIFLTMKVLDNTPAVLSLGKLCDENGYSYEWINGQKPHLIKDGIRIPCNTENFVPIVVPGLSSSSSGSSSTSKTPSRQESHSSSSSSASSSSPTVSEIQTREREDRIDSDISPVQVSNSVGDRSGRPDETQANKTQKPNKKETTIELGDPLYSEIPEWLQEFRENLWMMKFQFKEILTPVLLMRHLWSPHPRDVRIWVSTVVKLISPKTDIARSVKGPKLQGPHAGDAIVELYLVLKILVT